MIKVTGKELRSPKAERGKRGEKPSLPACEPAERDVPCGRALVPCASLRMRAAGVWPALACAFVAPGPGIWVTLPSGLGAGATPGSELGCGSFKVGHEAGSARREQAVVRPLSPCGSGAALIPWPGQQLIALLSSSARFFLRLAVFTYSREKFSCLLIS